MVTEPGPFHGIVLAAGLSRRLGRSKQLLDVGGKSLVRHVVERCLASRLDAVWVVVGHEAGAVRDALEGLEVSIVFNPAFESGQASSLVAGLDAASGVADAIIVALGDQPFIEPAVIDGLIGARRWNQAPIAMASYGDERGHPVLFAHELFAELHDITGDQGGREVIRRHREHLVLVPSSASSVPLDVDTEEAYALLLEQHANGNRMR
ncbi:MAG: nucleotidyltransferase family protein [Chloroflexia bacterium]|nr:nucleotidyltransferase family protein [Chloroflexia bacterium]